MNPTRLLGYLSLASLTVACGLVLDTVTRGRREMKMLAYLAQQAPESRALEPEQRP